MIGFVAPLIVGYNNGRFTTRFITLVSMCCRSCAEGGVREYPIPLHSTHHLQRYVTYVWRLSPQLYYLYAFNCNVRSWTLVELNPELQRVDTVQGLSAVSTVEVAERELDCG